MGGESTGLETKEEQVTRGHNIVADEWAGAANPLPNTDTFTKSFQNTRFPTFRLPLMDQQTDRWTDKASYRVACPRLKRQTRLIEGRVY